MKIYLASKSKLKIAAVQNCNLDVIPVQVDVPENPEQPFGFNATLLCALNRLNVLKKNTPKECLMMAIENGIYRPDQSVPVYYDICQVVFYDSKLDLLLTSQFFSDHLKIPVPSKYIYDIIDTNYVNVLGYNQTVGKSYSNDLSKKSKKHVPSDDWMSELGCPRNSQIMNVVNHVIALHPTSLFAKLKSEIIMIPDYPKKDVLFQDWMSLFSLPNLCDQLVELIANIGYQKRINLITGPELRGCMLGPLVAQKMKIPFVPIRKKGKLPPPTIDFTYEKEYGTDTLELNPNKISSKNCLIIDDVLATGGSLLACCELIKKAKGNPILSIVLNDVKELREKAKEQLNDYSYIVLMNMI